MVVATVWVTLMTTMKRGLIAMPRKHTGSVVVTHRVDWLASDHAF